MKKRHLYILIALAAVLAAVCLFPEVLHPGRHARMQALLDSLQTVNQADSLLTDDTLATALATYFDDHGTPNEQLLAHYILGRTHADRGEAPAAIAAYQEAISRADTTTRDCDYYIMASVYGQMAWLYHKLLLLSYEIEAHRKACRYNLLSGDTLNALYEQKMVAGAYILQNKADSAETLLKKVVKAYQISGYAEEALHSSMMLMHIYAESPAKIAAFRELIDSFESTFGLSDGKHELQSANRMYYFYKGRYCEMENLPDSAETCYRKVYHDDMPYTAKNAMYKGLLNVFERRQQPDSIAKYAKLYCAANDSSIALKDQELTAQTAASYDYSRFQQQAFENKERAHRTETMLAVVIIFCIISVAMVIYAARLYRDRQAARRRKMEDTYRKIVEEQKNAYRKELESLQSLCRQKESELQLKESIDKEVISVIQGELNSAESENKELRNKHVKAQQAINDIKMQYGQDIAALKEEIDILTEKMEALKHLDDFSSNAKRMTKILETDVVRQLKTLSATPQRGITEDEQESLEAAFCQYLPSFIMVLRQGCGLNSTHVLIALFTAIGLKPAEIQRLTGKSSSQITNAKTKINKVLFGQNSASTLYANLAKKFGF